ncbi:MAG: hypothetical protein WBG48_19270 [Pricia sp.]
MNHIIQSKEDVRLIFSDLNPNSESVRQAFSNGHNFMVTPKRDGI